MFGSILNQNYGYCSHDTSHSYTNGSTKMINALAKAKYKNGWQKKAGR